MTARHDGAVGDARKRVAIDPAVAEVQWTYWHSGNVVAPSLAAEEAKAFCPFGYRVVDIEMGRWECDTETIGFGEHSRTTHRFSTRIIVTAVPND